MTKIMRHQVFVCRNCGLRLGECIKLQEKEPHVYIKGIETILCKVQLS